MRQRSSGLAALACGLFLSFGASAQGRDATCALTVERTPGALEVSVNTVRNHVANISSKLGAHSKLEALAIATRRGLVSDT